MAEGLEPLNISHRLEGFDSGVPAIDKWFQERAVQAGLSRSAMTFVLQHDERVIAFQSLTVGEIVNVEADARLRAGMGNFAIPVLILARMGVHKDYQGQGIGKALLRDAIERTLVISENAGVRALITHPVDANARAFYLSFGFSENPLRPNELYLLLKDAAKHLN
jgi:GNAT superfamily N-acetyltransferase